MGEPFGYRKELFDFPNESRVFRDPAEVIFQRIVCRVIYNGVKDYG
jgi:hypothetical protein